MTEDPAIRFPTPEEIEQIHDYIRQNTFWVHEGDSRGQWLYRRPRCPSKASGRVGTRRSWKRLNPPGVWMLVTNTDLAGNVREQFWMR